VRAYTTMKTAFATIAICGVLLAAALTVSPAQETGQTPPGSPETGGNSKCYVCHPTMKAEAITVDHLAMDITCDQCHGPSIEHMHDEMLMTEPDLLFGRSEVERMCSDPSCHAPRDDRATYGLQDHKDPAKVKAFHDEWLGRTRPNGRAIMKNPVCTDCHGTHNLDEPLRSDDEEQAAEWTTLFNGENLTGWQSSGSTAWTVRRGRLIGKLQAGAKPVDLLTGEAFDNYLLAVTFRAEWPVRAGLWLRHTPNDPGARVEIFDHDHPLAFTGSIRLPGKGLALVNLRKDLTDRESWNTLSVRVEDGRIQVWLNAEEVGALVAKGPEKGKIGIHLETGPGANVTEIEVREVLVKKLPRSKSSNDDATAD
jgi:hypothetical protein